MEVGEIRDLVRRPSGRRAWLWAAACLLMAVPIGWSVVQYRWTREALDRAAAAERAAALGRPPMDPAVRRSRHDDPREIERVRQLYQEIDSLSQVRDEVDQTLRSDRPRVLRKAPSPAPAPRD